MIKKCLNIYKDLNKVALKKSIKNELTRIAKDKYLKD